MHKARLLCDAQPDFMVIFGTIAKKPHHSLVFIVAFVRKKSILFHYTFVLIQKLQIKAFFHTRNFLPHKKGHRLRLCPGKNCFAILVGIPLHFEKFSTP